MLPRRSATGIIRRHTIRGSRRKTLCAMRSAPRNGAVALGSLSHRTLEALQKAQQASTALMRGVHAVVDGVALASVAGHARCRGSSQFYSRRKWARWWCDLGRSASIARVSVLEEEG
jgi:hypothetical protein